jgi:hypothetical protein
MRNGITLVFALVCVSCATAPRIVGQERFGQAISFCEMMEHRDRYVGREVLVRGLFIMTPHQGEIYGAECENSSIALRGDVAMPRDKRVWSIIGAASKQIQGVRVPIVAKGVLRAWSGPGITTTDNQFWLERAQVVAADGEHVILPPA